jgi:hypothetical protein
MKNLIQRLKTLWRLSALDISYTENGKKINIDFKEKEVPKQAQIIKMNDPIKGFLQNENN